MTSDFGQHYLQKAILWDITVTAKRSNPYVRISSSCTYSVVPDKAGRGLS